LKAKIVIALCDAPLGKKALSSHLGQRVVSGPLHQAIRELVAEEWIEPTLPDKPHSRLQRYQLTAKARALLVDHAI
jgi:ATP-dependent DNA helicase RecG